MATTTWNQDINAGSDWNAVINLMKKDKINFIKINIFPDGGISRFRIYGKNV